MWEKGYQEVDSVVSSVTTKAKGVTMTNTSKLGFRIWDVADYVIPAQVCCPLRLCLMLKSLASSLLFADLAPLINDQHGQSANIPNAQTTCFSPRNQCVQISFWLPI